MSRVRELLKKYFYLKLCYTRSYSYFGIPLQLIQYFVLVSVWVKLFLTSVQVWVVVMIFAALLSLALILGDLDIKHKIAHEETKINNQINPELMGIHKVVVENKNNGGD